MTTDSRLQRLLTVGLLASLVIVAIAPEASARMRYRRYRGPVVERRVVSGPIYRSVRIDRHAPYARYTVWRSGRGPMFAGFLGGLFLGATLSNHAPHGFVYWDPYCHRGFESLELYNAHCRSRAHECEIEVVEAPQGYERGDVGDVDCRHDREDQYGRDDGWDQGQPGAQDDRDDEGDGDDR